MTYTPVLVCYRMFVTWPWLSFSGKRHSAIDFSQCFMPTNGNNKPKTANMNSDLGVA